MIEGVQYNNSGCYKDPSSKQNSAIIILLLFVIHPVISLPFIFIEIYNRKKYAIYLLALIYGYIGFFYPPVGDYYRYYIDYLDYSSMDFSSFSRELSSNLDYVVPSVLWFTGRLGINVCGSRFLFNAVCYSLFFYIFNDVTKNNNNKKQVFIFFLILNFLLGFRFGLVRFGLGTSFFVLGVYKTIIQKKIVPGLLISAFSVITHIALALGFLILCLHLFFPYKGNKIVTIILIITALVISSDLLTPLLNYLPIDASLLQHASYYIDGYFAEDYYLEHSIFFRIQQIIMRGGNYYSLFLFCLLFKKGRFEGFVDFFLVLIFIAGPFQEIHTRYETVLCCMIFFWCFDRLPYAKRIYTKSFLYLSVLLFLLSIYGVRRELSISKEYQLLYPTLFMSPNPYPNSWVDSHVDIDGSPLVY